jgi:peroxiredoxin
MKMIIKKVLIVLLLVFIGFTSLVGQEVGDKAPDFTFTSFNGEEFNLADQYGKVVFVFLVGYGCPYCIQNAPYIETEIYQKYKSNDNFVAIAIDLWDGSNSGIENFINSSGITFPILVNGSSLKETYDTSYDKLLVIDAEGIIRLKTSDNEYAKSEEADNALAIIDGLLTLSSLKKDRNYDPKLALFPNPANDFLMVNGDMLKNANARIFVLNSIGKVVYNEAIVTVSENIKLDINKLPSGVYFVQIVSGNEVVSKKFIKGK